MLSPLSLRLEVSLAESEGMRERQREGEGGRGRETESGAVPLHFSLVIPIVIPCYPTPRAGGEALSDSTVSLFSHVGRK